MLPRFIARRYRVLRLLGEGALGRVFLVLDQDTRGQVALKLLNPRARGFEERFRTFKSEFDVLRHFSHPNVVRVHDIGQDEQGQPFITAEYVAGPDLVEFGFADLDELAVLLEQLLSALEYVHGRGYVHRDVKGGNVLVQTGGPDGRGQDVVKLLDFGFASRAAPETSLRGTAEYLAPEALFGGPIDGRADLYSVGCLCYVLLTRHYPGGGAHPAQGRDLSQVRRDFERRHAPPAPSRYAPSIPTALESFVMRLLAFDPASRPASAAEAMGELRDAVAGRRYVPTRDTAPDSERFPFVDGSGALARVLELWDRGESTTVVVSGARRLGKSRLLEEVRAELAERGAEVIGCRFSESGDASQGPLTRIPRRILSFHPIRERELRESFPALFGGLVGGGEASLGLGRLEDELVAMLVPELAQRPVVLLVDDGQWADRESAWVLRAAAIRLAALAPRGSLFLLVVVVAAEQAALAPWKRGEPPPATCELQPFDGDGVARWLESAGTWSGDTRPLASLLAHESGGIPGVLEGCWRHLVESGTVRRKLGKLCAPARVDASMLPPHGDWPELDGLGESETSVLRALAAYDRFANVTELEAVARFEGRIEDALGTLERARLVRERDGRHRISAGSLRSRVYGAIPERQRRSLHRRIAEHLERRRLGDEGREELALHHARSSAPERAIPHAVAAARALVARHRFSRAAPLFGLVIEAASGDGHGLEPPELFQICLEAGRAALAAGMDAGVERAVAAAEAIARSQRDPILDARVVALRAVQRDERWRHRSLEGDDALVRTRAELEEQLARLDAAGRTGRERLSAELELRGLVASISARLGEHQRAIDAHQECLTLRQRQGDTRVQGTLTQLGAALMRAGRADDALWVCREAEAAARRHGDRHVVATACELLGMLHAGQDQIAASAESFKRAAEILLSLGLETRAAGVRQNLAEVHVEMGSARDAARVAREVIDHFGAEFTGARSVRARLTLGKACYLLADYPRARRELEAVVAFVEERQVKDLGLALHSRTYLGLVEVELGRGEAGDRMLEAALVDVGEPDELPVRVFENDIRFHLATCRVRALVADWLAGTSSPGRCDDLLGSLEAAAPRLGDAPAIQRSTHAALLGCVAALAGRDGAWQGAERALAPVAASEHRLAVARVGALAGTAAFVGGMLGPARRLLEQTLDIASSVQVLEAVAQVRGLLALVLAEQGKLAAARVHHRARLDAIKEALAFFPTRDEQVGYLSEPLRAALFRRAREAIHLGEETLA